MAFHAADHALVNTETPSSEICTILAPRHDTLFILVADDFSCPDAVEFGNHALLRIDDASEMATGVALKLDPNNACSVGYP